MADAFIVRRGGGGGSGGFPQYTYTGQSQLIDDGNRNWRIKFLTSGTLTFTRLGSASAVDVFLVGGGGGGSGSGEGGPGAGGGGGYTKTATRLAAQIGSSYPIVIGTGGASVGTRTDGIDGGNTSAFGITASGGKKGNWDSEFGGNGGSGGAGYNTSFTISTDGNDSSTNKGGKGQRSTPGPDGETGTTREFGEATGELYSNGGGSRYTGAAGQELPRANHGDGGHGRTGSSIAGADGIVIIRNAR